MSNFRWYKISNDNPNDKIDKMLAKYSNNKPNPFIVIGLIIIGVITILSLIFAL